MALVLTLFLALSACSKEPAERTTSQPSDDAQSSFVAAEDRLVSRFLEDGWVVSRHADGSPEHQGDSLLFTGIALGTLDCAHKHDVEWALAKMLEDLGGGLYRHPSLSQKVSLDGALGLYFGLATGKKCPDSMVEWGHHLLLHRNYLHAHSMKLNEQDSAQLVPEFDYVLDLLASSLGVADQPDDAQARSLETEVSAWALGVKARKAACYRVHLGWLTLRSLEALGKLSQRGRADFCGVTDGMDLPVIDHWCGRGDLQGWIAGFQENQWEFRHQRCGGWEKPDGQGLETPGLDLLVAMKAAYNL
jgi:hypothetical protein